MGYFSNGTEGSMYEERYCQRCINWREDPETETAGCPVMDAHLMFNYEQLDHDEESGGGSGIGSVLSILIPRTNDGRNAECRMFIRAPSSDGTVVPS